MKVLYYLPILAFSLLLSSCGNTETKKELVQYDMSNLDTTAVVGDNFYQYATGGWQKANVMKDEFARYGSFDVLREKSQKDINDIIHRLGESSHADGTVGQKVGDLYGIAMDSAKLNTEGANPIKKYLDQINAAESRADIIKLVAEIRQYANSPFFGFGVAADQKNSAMNIVLFGQGGLGMDRDYYLNDDSTSVALREGYRRLIKTQFALVDGALDAETSKTADAIIKLETELAKSHLPRTELRIAEKNYNKMKVGELKSKVANFDWTAFFDAAGVANKSFDEINVRQIIPVAKGAELINTAKIEDIKAYLSWCVINASAQYISDNFATADFDFYGRQMSGKKEMQPRWKRATDNVDSFLSEALGQLYVEKHFPAEAKERMVALVKNLQVTLGERIDNLSWMSNETKVKAQEKLNTFHVKIGYPDKWKDYSALKIEKDNYWENRVRAGKFYFAENIDKIGKPVDKEEWLMSPQTVNAYYMPTTNEICFPAAILQAPFFYLDGDDAVNYGAIGVVIGHEMSHGFDDQGSKYNKDGNMANWWTEEDKTKFDERAQVLVDHFDAIEILPASSAEPALMANGKFTLGENIGDFGGVQIAYNAFEKTEQAKAGEKIENFTPEQRFFLSYAGVWAGHIREAEMRRLTQIDPHSLGKWRVDGTLPHINAWYKAFDIKEDAKLYIPTEKRADIW